MNPDVEILEKTDSDHVGVIDLLERIQARYGYLPENELRIVAEQTGRSLVDVYGVATFYKAFSLKPRGKHLISVCLGTACHVQGGQRIAEAFQATVGDPGGRDHTGPGFLTRDGELPGGLRPGSRGGGGRALLFQSQNLDGQGHHRDRPAKVWTRSRSKRMSASSRWK